MDGLSVRINKILSLFFIVSLLLTNAALISMQTTAYPAAWSEPKRFSTQNFGEYQVTPDKPVFVQVSYADPYGSPVSPYVSQDANTQWASGNVQPVLPVVNPVINNTEVESMVDHEVDPTEKTVLGNAVDWVKKNPVKAALLVAAGVKTGRNVAGFYKETGARNTLETAAATAQIEAKKALGRRIEAEVRGLGF